MKSTRLCWIFSFCERSARGRETGRTTLGMKKGEFFSYQVERNEQLASFNASTINCMIQKKTPTSDERQRRRWRRVSPPFIQWPVDPCRKTIQWNVGGAALVSSPHKHDAGFPFPLKTLCIKPVPQVHERLTRLVFFANGRAHSLFAFIEKGCVAIWTKCALRQENMDLLVASFQWHPIHS